MELKKIAENIKNAREDKKISVYNVEKHTGIKHQSIYNWEQGKQEPTILNCIKLADYYGISLDELVGRDFF